MPPLLRRALLLLKDLRLDEETISGETLPDSSESSSLRERLRGVIAMGMSCFLRKSRCRVSRIWIYLTVLETRLIARLFTLRYLSEST